MNTIACIASIPEREGSLLKTIESLKGQCHLFIALNGYSEVPEFVKKHNHILFKKNRGDQAKFYFYSHNSIFYENWFFCDDDLIYPRDYISTSLKHLKKYPNAILSYHGRRLPNRPIKSYYKDRLIGFRCLMDVNEYQDLGTDGALGTGVMFFKSRMVKMKMSDFKHNNMADVWLAKFAIEQGRKIIVCPHKEGWIIDQTIPGSINIFEQHYENDGRQTNIYNSIPN